MLATDRSRKVRQEKQNKSKKRSYQENKDQKLVVISNH
jgi:hypothetical protein